MRPVFLCFDVPRFTRSIPTDTKRIRKKSPLIDTNAVRTDLVGYRAAKHRNEKNVTRTIKFHITVSYRGDV